MIELFYGFCFFTVVKFKLGRYLMVFCALLSGSIDRLKHRVTVLLSSRNFYLYILNQYFLWTGIPRGGWCRVYSPTCFIAGNYFLGLQMARKCNNWRNTDLNVCLYWLDFLALPLFSLRGPCCPVF